MWFTHCCHLRRGNDVCVRIAQHCTGRSCAVVRHAPLPSMDERGPFKARVLTHGRAAGWPACPPGRCATPGAGGRAGGLPQGSPHSSTSSSSPLSPPESGLLHPAVAPKRDPGSIPSAQGRLWKLDPRSLGSPAHGPACPSPLPWPPLGFRLAWEVPQKDCGPAAPCSKAVPRR